jgi:predicted transposase YdaD
LLEVALSNKIDPEEKMKILEEKYSIPMTVDLEEEIVNMCNLSEGVRDEGIEIGLERGRAEGREEGRAEGLAEGDEKRIIISIENLMKNLKLSFDQAMNALGIPETDRAYYANAINEK